jgi:hypothetical protein
MKIEMAKKWASSGIVLAILLAGGLAAYSQWWVTDDAYISFRYARNLTEGMGLVFNEGERVEGYSNFLWTLWVAVGLAFGCEAESWANFWSIAFYLGSVLLLLLNHHAWNRMTEGSSWLIPVAALAAVLHRDWTIYATSGMETSLFTFLLLSSFLAAVWSPSSWPRLALAGLLAGLAALTRPDGVLPAFVLGLFVLYYGKPRGRAAIFYAASFAVVWLPFVAWRLQYYGDLFPNTYYAKSAYLAWYEQGWHYLALYFEKYWALLFGPALLLLYLVMRRDRGEARHVVLAAAMAVAYTFYIVRVGGDFMFARMLVPATPFYLLLLEFGLTAVFRNRPLYGYGAAAILLAGMFVTPPPVSGTSWRHGIADERLYYSEERVARLGHKAQVLRRFFEGLPVRIAFYGDEARVAYKGRFPVAIESHAGLTEPEIARRELQERGRVGHEKHASARYLIEKRKAHFTFSSVPGKLLGLRALIPHIIVRFDEEVYGQVLHWDPEIMEAMRLRGAIVPDFISSLDSYIEQLDHRPDEEVARAYEQFNLFYFMHVDDPIREDVFKRRLGVKSSLYVGQTPNVQRRLDPL